MNNNVIHQCYTSKDLIWRIYWYVYTRKKLVENKQDKYYATLSVIDAFDSQKRRKNVEPQPRQVELIMVQYFQIQTNTNKQEKPFIAQRS